MSTPRASKEQWALALGLYCKGVRHEDICREAGVSLTALRKKISDKKWTALRRRGDELAPLRPLTLKERSAIIRENIACDLQVSSEKLVDLKRSSDPLQERERQAVVGGIVSAADKVFAWSENSPGKSLFDFEKLDNARTIEGPPPPDAITVDYLPNGKTRLTQFGKVIEEK